MKEEYAIAIMAGSPSSTVELVSRTFDSIRKCFRHGSYRILLQIGTKISAELRTYVESEAAHSGDISVLGVEDVDWSDFINHAIDEAAGCTYFIKSHDDIELLTPGFCEKIEALFAKHPRDLGWISFTDVGYRYGDFSPPVREGYFDDVLFGNAFNTMRVFQFHDFPPNWTRAAWPVHYTYAIGKRIRRKLGIPLRRYPKRRDAHLRYEVDIPDRPVKCHAPFNHFVLIRYDILRTIGYCERWGTRNALLVDEDWGLRALRLNIPNVWLPSIEYFHNRGEYGYQTRSWNQIRTDATRVDELFCKKWGFHPSPSPAEMEVIKKKYGETLVVWSIGRKSYEWDYLDED